MAGLVAQPASTPPIGVSFGLRAGLTDYAFRPADNRNGWERALQARVGYALGGFTEASAANGALRLRADVGLITHRQHYQLGGTEATRTDLAYRATELSVSPVVLVRVFRLPLYVVGGVEINRVLRSRVQGRYLLAAPGSSAGYTLIQTDASYRTNAATDVRPTLGVSAIISRRFDVTVRVAWGGNRFRAYAPRELSGYQAIGAFASSLLNGGAPPSYPTMADFRAMQVFGNQLSVGYRFGAVAAGSGRWRK